MRLPVAVLLAFAAWTLTGCSHPEKPAPAARTSEPERRPARITQFYTPSPMLEPGQKALLCYGTEDARTVWLSPPRHELSPALSQCVEVTPSATTTYTLTAAGADGQSVKQELTVRVGAPHARIIDVTVSSLEVKRGQPVSICYRVENAGMVRIEPIAFQRGPAPQACTSDFPSRTTTYVITATGVAGDKDQERVTVKVQ